eukprot:GAHX01001827.1.p1 GENE.GAHX01001827.1~~GAHX01001827.1.p1  ORF type:complete len:151 (-),score=17.70 GAHX01001827.1:123-575(-)
MIEKLSIPSNRTPPSGWGEIEGILIKYENKMLEIYMESSGNRSSKEMLWKISKLNKEKTLEISQINISKTMAAGIAFGVELGYIDTSLLRQCNKRGFEKLCCMNCITPQYTENLRKCICRVRSNDIVGTVFTECNICGCMGCHSQNREQE